MKSILKKCICSIVALSAMCCSVAFMPTKTASADTLTTESAAKEVRYYDEPLTRETRGQSEAITFARKEEAIIEFPNAVPNYYTNNHANACGPVAGANIVGYYDKYYEDLIPDYTAYYPANGRYRRPDKTYVPALIDSLYTLMQTNVVDVGVSESECLEGLKAYVEGKNHTISYTNLKPIVFNMTAYKNAVSNQIPVLLFCGSTELYILDSGDTQDDILYAISSGAHIVVGHGYREIKYYDANNNLFRTETLLEVSTGWVVNSWGYLKANNISWLNSAYVVDVS